MTEQQTYQTIYQDALLDDCPYCTHRMPGTYGRNLAHLKVHKGRNDIYAIYCDTPEQVVKQLVDQTRKTSRTGLQLDPKRATMTTQAVSAALKYQEPEAPKRQATPWPTHTSTYTHSLKNPRSQPLNVASAPSSDKKIIAKAMIDASAEEDNEECEYDYENDSALSDTGVKEHPEDEAVLWDQPVATRQQMLYWKRHRRHAALSYRQQLNILFDKVASIAGNVEIQEEILSSVAGSQSSGSSAKSPKTKKQKVEVFQELITHLKNNEPYVKQQREQSKDDEKHISPRAGVKKSLFGSATTGTTTSQFQTIISSPLAKDESHQLEFELVSSVAPTIASHKTWKEIKTNDNHIMVKSKDVPKTDFDYSETEYKKIDVRESNISPKEKGLFATGLITTKSIILEFVGVMQLHPTQYGTKSIRINEIVVDATLRGNIARYIQISADSMYVNCHVELLNFPIVGLKAMIISDKTIKKGDELCMYPPQSA